MHMVKTIKVEKLSPKLIIKLEIIFALAERFIVQVLKMPDSFIYIVDIMNLYLLVCLINSQKWKRFIGFILAYAGIIIISLPIGILCFNEWGGNLASVIVEIRNIVRFPIFFLACATFLDENQIIHIYKILTAFFAINMVAIIYQYITFHPPGVWMRGDMLNGLFGTETGGNTFVNVIFLIVVIYLLVCWINKEKSVIPFVLAVCASLLVSALIELKAFFVEIIIIYGFYLVKKEKTKKEIFLNVFFVIAAIAISAIGLQIMYREYPWFRGSLSVSSMIKSITGNGYTGDGDLNRFTGIFTIASRFFHGNLTDVLVGIGIGNASQISVLGSKTIFFNMYSSSHYDWFSSTYMFVQGGALGLLSYLFTFAYLFIKKKQNKRFELNVQIICILAVFLVFYGEALRTDAGYFIYFALASGFVKNEKNKRNIECEGCMNE